MSERWFFTHGGITFGPIPAVEFDQLVAAGKVGPRETAWLEGYDVQMTVAQYSGLRKTANVPDWLGDVMAFEQPAAVKLPVAPGQPAPDWLADVRQLE